MASIAETLPRHRRAANIRASTAFRSAPWILLALLRRPFSLGRARGSVYLDVRNLLNRRNLVAVRRDTGTPDLPEERVIEEAEIAYQDNPGPIPFESSRYRPWADSNGDGVIQGRAELYPLYLSAARDFYQPLFAYGPPRLLRVGVELGF